MLGKKGGVENAAPPFINSFDNSKYLILYFLYLL